MKESKKVVSYRIRETTIESVREEAKEAGMSINDYADQKLSKPKKSTPKK